MKKDVGDLMRNFLSMERIGSPLPLRERGWGRGVVARYSNAGCAGAPLSLTLSHKGRGNRGGS
jgi:hypothetical protein